MPASKNKLTPAERLRQVATELKKTHASEISQRLSSVEELVQAVLVDDGIDDDEALAAVYRLRGAYVDLNEARVSRLAEIARLLAVENADDLARAIRELLGRIFDRTGGVHLDHLHEMKTSEAKRALMEIEPVSRAVTERILMAEVPGANMPFDTETVRYTKKLKLIANNANKAHLQKLIHEELNREETTEFFHLIEHHVAIKVPKTKDTLLKKFG